MIEIEALKFLGKEIEFTYVENNLENSYKGFVKSIVIESDGNHKICLELGEDNSDFFEVDQMFKVKY